MVRLVLLFVTAITVDNSVDCYKLWLFCYELLIASRTFLLGLTPFVRIVSLVLGETIIFLTAAIGRLETRARRRTFGEYFPVAFSPRSPLTKGGYVKRFRVSRQLGTAEIHRTVSEGKREREKKNSIPYIIVVETRVDRKRVRVPVRE